MSRMESPRLLLIVFDFLISRAGGPLVIDQVWAGLAVYFLPKKLNTTMKGHPVLTVCLYKTTAA